MIKAICKKRKFDLSTDRLGPDCPFTHWKLYFENTKEKLCKKMFAYFGDGADFRAGAYAVNCSKIELGENVIIRPNTMLFADPRGHVANIVIADNVMIGSGVHIYTANHKFSDSSIEIMFQGHFELKPVQIGKGAWIGANCTILPGVVIGENSVIAAGSVVTKSIPSYSLYAGVPAKLVRKLKNDE